MTPPGSEHRPVIEGAGPLATVLGPADWTHGIARPFQGVVADPNPNLTFSCSGGRWAYGWAPACKRDGGLLPGLEPEAERCWMVPARSAGLDVGDFGAFSEGRTGLQGCAGIQLRARSRFKTNAWPAVDAARLPPM